MQPVIPAVFFHTIKKDTRKNGCPTNKNELELPNLI